MCKNVCMCTYIIVTYMYTCMYNSVALKVCYHDVFVVIVPMPHADRGCEIKIIVIVIHLNLLFHTTLPHTLLFYLKQVVYDRIQCYNPASLSDRRLNSIEYVTYIHPSPSQWL